ncbi:MAG: hypothetical protein ACI9SG_000897 [Maribacter sp.]|jgi:hypothetical protein
MLQDDFSPTLNFRTHRKKKGIEGIANVLSEIILKCAIELFIGYF